MSDFPSISTWSELSEEERSALLSRPAVEANAELMTGAAAIVERVRVGGDDALRELTREYDGVDIETLRVSEDEFTAAFPNKKLLSRRPWQYFLCSSACYWLL